MLLDNRIPISPFPPPFFSLTKSLPRDRPPCCVAPTCSELRSCLQKSFWYYWTNLCSITVVLIFFPVCFQWQIIWLWGANKRTALNLFQFSLKRSDFISPASLTTQRGFGDVCSPQTYPHSSVKPPQTHFPSGKKPQRSGESGLVFPSITSHLSRSTVRKWDL